MATRPTTASAIPYPPSSVPAGTAPVTVSATVSGLQQYHLFHYRLVAYHQVGPPSYGADEVFLTEPSPKFKPARLGATTPHRARTQAFRLHHLGADQLDPRRSHRRLTATAMSACGSTSASMTSSFVLLPVALELHVLGPDHAAPQAWSWRAKSHKSRLKVVVYFRGNGYLKPRFAKSQVVTVG